MSTVDSRFATPKGRSLVIKEVHALQILDSRGLPTLQVELDLEDGHRVQAASPTGTSTGGLEVAELRDHGPAYSGHGVRSAVAVVEGELATLLTSRPWESIRELDDAMRELDGRPQLSRLGGNCLVALSMAAARGFADLHEMSLHAWVASELGATESLPIPYFNIVNGGLHATNSLAFQEFMIVPAGASSIEAAIECGAEIYQVLSRTIGRSYRDTGLGDEGGFALAISRPEDALDMLMEAIREAGYTPGVNTVAIALDAAANSFYRNEGYQLENVTISSTDLVDYYHQLARNYPIRSIEDGLAENDRDGWRELFARIGDSVQVVGDDLFVTDAARIERGATEKLANAAVIKPNQTGTVSGTFAAIDTARRHGMRSIVSHRSGETLDTFIADLAVGSGAGQFKAGAPARGERVAKYNRLIEIAAETPGLGYGATSTNGSNHLAGLVNH
jgi:enolase